MAVDVDQLFRDLPADPLLASYELVQRINKQVLPSKPTDDDYTVACGILEAFYEANAWQIPARINPGGYTGSDSAEDIARKTRAFQRLQYEAYLSQIMANYREVAKKKAKAALDGALAKAPGYAVLNADEKKEIHSHIETIRSIIESSGLEDRKRNALLGRLTDLAAEVNRNGTRTDRFFAFASELGFCIGQFTENAKPAIAEAKSILRIVAHARARHDGIKLPPGEDVPLLPDPDANL